jgi:hypothetical protein
MGAVAILAMAFATFLGQAVDIGGAGSRYDGKSQPCTEQ